MRGYLHTHMKTVLFVCVYWLVPVLCSVSGYTPPYKEWESVPTPIPIEPPPDEPDDGGGGTAVVGEEEGEGHSPNETGEVVGPEPTTPAAADGSEAGHIIGACVGIGTLLVVAFVLAFYMWRKRTRRYANTYCVAAQEENFIKKAVLRENGHGPSATEDKLQSDNRNGSGDDYHQDNENAGSNEDTVPFLAFSVSDSLEDRDRSMGESCTPKSPLSPVSLEPDMQQVTLSESPQGSVVARTPPARSLARSETQTPTSTPGSLPRLGKGEVWTESQVLQMMDAEEVFTVKDEENSNILENQDDVKSVQSEEVFMDAPSPGSSVEIVSGNSPEGDPIGGDPFGSTDTFRSAISHFDKQRSLSSIGGVVYEEKI